MTSSASYISSLAHIPVTATIWKSLFITSARSSPILATKLLALVQRHFQVKLESSLLFVPNTLSSHVSQSCLQPESDRFPLSPSCLSVLGLAFSSAPSPLLWDPECFNDWTICVQSRQQIAIVYVDLAKAFDVVSHNKLFVRLHTYGLCGSVLLWVQNFFTNCTHQTKVGPCVSDSAAIISGVVQGSGIGPLMFLVYINELA